MTVQGWRAWYANGRSYDSKTIRPEDLPKQGLQIVMLYLDPPYREILCGADFIVWNGHQWQSVMDVPVCPTCIVFPGSWMASFDELQEQALRSYSL